MRRPVFAAHHAACTVSNTVARGVGNTVFICLNGKLQVTADTARILTITTGVRAKLVAREEQRKANFNNFDGAEFEAAC